jgi:tetratricopeptide (TPR) repeat protein
VGRIVARAPRGGAAKPAPAPKAYGLSIGEMKFDRAALVGHGRDAYVAGEYAHAAALYERAYELTPARDVALEIYRCYQKLGDQKSAEHWLAVHRGAATGNEPPVAYQQF